MTEKEILLTKIVLYVKNKLLLTIEEAESGIADYNDLTHSIHECIDYIKKELN